MKGNCARVGAAWTLRFELCIAKTGRYGAVCMEGRKEQTSCAGKLQAGRKKKTVDLWIQACAFFPHFGICLFYFPLPAKRLFIRGSNGAQAVWPASLVLHQIRPHCQPGPVGAALKMLFTGPSTE